MAEEPEEDLEVFSQGEEEEEAESENTSDMEGTNGHESPKGTLASELYKEYNTHFSSSHLLRMLEAAAARRSVDIHFADVTTEESNEVTEPARDTVVENVSLLTLQ